MVTIGNGGTNEGEFHEGLNMANAFLPWNLSACATPAAIGTCEPITTWSGNVFVPANADPISEPCQYE
ncbi:hypothetical protein [Mycoplasmopsis bovis]|uniref:hypothetical protein n=1 Tax=Mycoplasmopsis bovis TaxID=28903 RepID=UPI003D27DDC8